MKKYFLLLIGVMLLSVSCIKDYSTLTEFVIENKSNQKIKIQVSNFETVFYSSVDTVFSIDENSNISCEYEQKGEDAKYEFPFGSSSDSIIIFFNDSISIFYYKGNTSPRNPLNIDNYSGGKVDDGLYRYIYEITNKNYQEAIFVE